MAFGAALSAAPIVGNSILLLHGGDIPESHAYFEAAIEMAKDHRISFDKAPAGWANVYQEGDRGKYAAIVISDYVAYQKIEASEKERLDKYCRDFNVGQFFLHIPKHKDLNGGEVGSAQEAVMADLKLKDHAGYLKLTKNGGKVDGKYSGRYFRVRQNVDNYPILVQSFFRGEDVSTIVLDLGKYDGIKRVFFGHDFVNFWFYELLFMDGLQWLSPSRIPYLESRWIGVDIDDIFLPVFPERDAVKMQAEDVQALLDSQKEISELSGNPFKYSVGYNSNWYEKVVAPPPYNDAAGDRAFVENREQFFWFDHLPGHEKSSTLAQEALEALMLSSKAWAETHDVLRLIGKYQVSPYHDGIFPVYEPLYQAWRKIWGVETTSTVFINQGMVHADIMVAPRTDLGVAGRVFSWDQVDREHLEAAARGGFLFRRVLSNPVNIIMTHQANFARDRVALSIFMELVRFTNKWTNFKLVNLPSDGLVRKYFEITHSP